MTNFGPLFTIRYRGTGVAGRRKSAMEGRAVGNKTTSRRVTASTAQSAYGRREFLTRGGVVLGAVGLGSALVPVVRRGRR